MPLWEVVCTVIDDDALEVGDIIAARNPLGFAGTQEQARFFWLTVDTQLTRSALTTPGPRGLDRTMLIDLAAVALDNGLDLARILNPLDQYQPLLGQPAVANHHIQVKV